MRRLKRICMGLAVLALFISVHAASAAPVIRVEPANIEVSEGESFDVTITVDPGGVEVMGVQYKLQFDNTRLNTFAQSKGTFLSHDGASTMDIKNERNNTIGLIEYGEMRTGIEYGANTTGIVATITFNATMHGVSSLTLLDVVMSDPDTNVGRVPDVSSNNGTCTIRSNGTGTPTPTATQTATEPPSTGMATPTATGALTPMPTETAPAATPTVTVVEAASADQTPPTEPQSTASPLATPKQTMKRPSDDNISGFTSVFAMMGLLIALYVISKGKR